MGRAGKYLAGALGFLALTVILSLYCFGPESTQRHLAFSRNLWLFNRRAASSSLARGAKFSFLFNYLATAIFSIAFPAACIRPIVWGSSRL